MTFSDLAHDVNSSRREHSGLVLLWRPNIETNIHFIAWR